MHDWDFPIPHDVFENDKNVFEKLLTTIAQLPRSDVVFGLDVDITLMNSTREQNIRGTNANRVSSSNSLQNNSEPHEFFRTCDLEKLSLLSF